MGVQKITKYSNVLNGTNADGSQMKFEDLSEEEQKALEEYYESVNNKNQQKMMLMARESSIQLVYQNALILYQFVYQPMRELDFTNTSTIKPASNAWMLSLGLQLFSVCLSANSTFSPIIDYHKFKSYKKNKPIGFFGYTAHVFQVVLHIIFATGVVYLLKGKKTHLR